MLGSKPEIDVASLFPQSRKIAETSLHQRSRRIKEEDSASKVIELFLDYDPSVSKYLLVVRTEQDYIILDYLREGNLSWMGPANAVQILDAIITPSLDGEDWTVMIYFNFGNLVAYRSDGSYSEISGTDFPVVAPTDPSMSQDSRFRWGRHVFLNNNFWVISPFPFAGSAVNSSIIGSDPAIYYSDRPEIPWGGYGSAPSPENSYVATYDSFLTSSGFIDPLTEEQSPSGLSMSNGNCRVVFDFHNILNGSSSGSGSLISSHYLAHPLITSAAGQKTCTRSSLRIKDESTDPCEPRTYEDRASVRFDYSIHLEFSLLYGDSSDQIGSSTGTYDLNCSTPEYGFQYLAGNALTRTLISTNPDVFACLPANPIFYPGWAYRGIRNYGEHYAEWTINVPIDRFGATKLNTLIEKEPTVNYLSRPFPVRRLASPEFSSSTNTSRLNCWGLPMPRNIAPSGGGSGCPYRGVSLSVPDRTTYFQVYSIYPHFLGGSSDAVTRIGSIHPRREKDVQPGIAYDATCVVVSDHLPTYSPNVESFAIYESTALGESIESNLASWPTLSVLPFCRTALTSAGSGVEYRRALYTTAITATALITGDLATIPAEQIELQPTLHQTLGNASNNKGLINLYPTSLSTIYLGDV